MGFYLAALPLVIVAFALLDKLNDQLKIIADANVAIANELHNANARAAAAQGRRY